MKNPLIVAAALGPDILGQFAERAGVGAGQAPSVLAQVLPELVNPLIPREQVPQGQALDGMLGSLLGPSRHGSVSRGRARPDRLESWA